nr:MAG TPA: hypothetical protein [Caudoviricetes sp.]
MASCTLVCGAFSYVVIRLGGFAAKSLRMRLVKDFIIVQFQLIGVKKSDIFDASTRKDSSMRTKFVLRLACVQTKRK